MDETRTATRCSHWKTCLHASCRASRPEAKSESARQDKTELPAEKKPKR